jgi:lysophospholipase L1-like esterase
MSANKLWIALHVFVLVLVIVGVVALWSDVTAIWRMVMAVIVVAVAGVRLLPLTRWLGSTGTKIEHIGAVAGLLVVPVFALLGIDAVLALLGANLVSAGLRLLVGAVIVLLVGRISLEPFWTDHVIPHAWALAGGAVVVLLIVPTLVIALIGQLHGDEKKLDQRAVVSKLDLIVLRGDPAPHAATTSAQGNWRIHTWTGQVTGDRITWADGQEPRLDGEADADRVLLLLPPRSENGAVDRWMALADRVEPRATLTYAVLRSPDAAQLEAWRRPLSSVVGRAGDARDLADLGGDSASEADLGLRATTQRPTAAADLALAIAHRPVLRFDTREPVARPLDVDGLLRTGEISMCEGGQKLRSRCIQIFRGAELQTGFNHLAFDTHTLATADVESRIYVHVTDNAPDTSSDGEAQSLIYLDYWWYLPDNPAHSGSGAFCGPGFSIAGATCFDHQSDWEGVTVILDAHDAAGTPVAVNYAEHDGTVRYSWAALRRLWEQTRADGLAPTGALDSRPLVFSARGTHASYPVACGKHSCPRNVVPGVRHTAALQDNPHNGKIPWSGNTDDGDTDGTSTDHGCANTCVAELPTRRGGAEAEGWNAWAGEWGTANCVMGLFCASDHPPHSPGQQRRYKYPWCTSGVFDLVGGRFTGPGPVPPCVTQSVPSGRVVPGKRLLALGDSYSSGEGAGDYEPGTNTPSNGCHRSRSAWPALFARERRLQALPSLACSGATVTDVLTGRKHGETERQRSQLGRIARSPDVLTITIGGNDLGFRSVLERCMAVNCIHRGADDPLDAKIDALALRLPDVYRAIQAAAPGGRVVVVDYPRLFPDSDPSDPTPNCAAEGLISPAEGNYLNRKVERADVAILDAAREAGVDAIDVSNALEGGQLSCSGKQYLNHASPQLKVLSGSFHPNADGQERLARVVSAHLAALDR